MRLVTLVSMTLAALVAGCAVATLTTPTAREAAPVLGIVVSPASDSPLGLPAPDGTGGVRVAVRWPAYEAQQLTYSTVALDVAVLDAQLATVATASIVRPAAEARLARVPSGLYTLAVQAKAADRTVTAQASASLRIVPNRLASVPLSLVALRVPVVSGLSRSVVQAGGSFWIFGTNLLPPAGGTYSVMVDGKAVPNSALQPGDTAIAVTAAPAWLTATSRVSLSVDGIAAAGSWPLALRVIDHVSITPAIATMSVGSSQTFQWRAYLDAEGLQEVTEDVRFDARLIDVSPALNPNTGLPPFVLNGNTVSTAATGSFTLLVTEEGKSATLHVAVVQPAPTPSPTPFDAGSNPGGGVGGGPGGGTGSTP